ncbi:MAG: DUF2735 domain-containing protein [Bradyrhizobium sp.]
MNTDLNQASAKIYQFPPGGRAALGRRHHEETKPAAGQGSPPTEACSGSWYHEDAIEESDPTWHR